MELFVCPKINKLDPATEGFDGDGHATSFAAAPGRCHEAINELDRTCDLVMEPASDAWRKFYNLPPAPAAAE